jgi:hypothetical protein
MMWKFLVGLLLGLFLASCAPAPPSCLRVEQDQREINKEQGFAISGQHK